MSLLICGFDSDHEPRELAVDSSGRVRLAGGSFANYNTTGTKAVKAAPGVLHRVSVNMAGSENSTATVYDNTAASGDKVCVISTASAVTLEYFAACSVGITAVLAGDTVADITIVYE